MTTTSASSVPLRALRQRLTQNPLIVDGLIAVGLTVLSVLTLVAGAQDFGDRDPLSLLLLMLQTLPLVLRRRFPLGILVVTLGATIGHALLATGPVLNSSIGALVALYTAAERLDGLRSALAGVIAGAAIAVLINAKVGFEAGLSGLLQSLLSLAVVWLLGRWSRERRRYIGTVEERARLAEHEREERAVRAVAEERERIARELHDVVTHHVSVIVIQAGAGLRALDRRPADARAALEAIDGTARIALTDMRRMLGILGPRPGPATGGAAGGGTRVAAGAAIPAGGVEPPAPMPGLDRLGELIEHVRAAGMPVELSVVGQPRPLDPGVELSAYRIIQEALTNSLKHARGARARVDVHYEPEAIEVRVVDEGGRGEGGIVPGGEGHGLIGMRERVALFGGRFEAGRTGTGFRVSARLPLDSQSAAGA